MCGNGALLIHQPWKEAGWPTWPLTAGTEAEWLTPVVQEQTPDTRWSVLCAWLGGPGSLPWNNPRRREKNRKIVPGASRFLLDSVQETEKWGAINSTPQERNSTLLPQTPHWSWQPGLPFWLTVPRGDTRPRTQCREVVSTVSSSGMSIESLKGTILKGYSLAFEQSNNCYGFTEFICKI